MVSWILSSWSAFKEYDRETDTQGRLMIELRMDAFKELVVGGPMIFQATIGIHTQNHIEVSKYQVNPFSQTEFLSL